MSKRVYELAKEIGLTSKELIARLDEHGVQVKGHMSSVDDKHIDWVYSLKKDSSSAAPKAPAKKKAVKKTSSKPKETKAKQPKAAEKAEESKAPKTVKPEAEKPKQSEQKAPAEKAEPAKAAASSEPKQEKKPEPQEKPVAQAEQVSQVADEPQASSELREIDVKVPISVGDLAKKLDVKANQLIKTLMGMKIFASINQSLGQDLVEQVLSEFNCCLKTVEKSSGSSAKQGKSVEDQQEAEQDKPEDLEARSPIITMMGHVDHGKTSLLDAIRNARVADREAGGITQHIGAYEVNTENGRLVFLDTPGHEAFTAMRARGANVTDVIILVVAADDGVMPQTIEAINHAKAAGVVLVVAVNKCDKEGADSQRVRTQLMEHDLVPEEWGGKTIFKDVSAITRDGIDELLEMVLLESEMLELKANPNKSGRGHVIEAHLSKGRGAVATLLVTEGTLKVGDIVVADKVFGKVRALINDQGATQKSAGPATPVEVLGLNGTPIAGDHFSVVASEKIAREIAEAKQAEEREQRFDAPAKQMTLEDFYAQVSVGDVKELPLVLKADNTGSLEALRESLLKLSGEKVNVKILHQAIGAIGDADVDLAAASSAIILGFHVRPESKAQDRAEKMGVQIKTYRIIYEAIEEVKNAMEGMLEAKKKEVEIGKAEVRAVFRSSKLGSIAGSFVLKGKIQRNAFARLVRDGAVVHEGKIASIKRLQDDVKEVLADFECGILLEKYNDIKENDIIEAYVYEYEKQLL